MSAPSHARRHAVEIADVAFDEGEPRRRFLADPFRHVVEVVPVARREVVEPDDPLPRLEQGLHEVRADEPRAPGDGPRQRFGGQEGPEKIGSHRGGKAGGGQGFAPSVPIGVSGQVTMKKGATRPGIGWAVYMIKRFRTDSA